MAQQAFWMVWSPSGSAPGLRHRRREQAEQEAKRLAELRPGEKFFVFRAEREYVYGDMTCTDYGPALEITRESRETV